jgi:hypothetical protein
VRLPDPCPDDGFDGASLKPLDLLTTVKSLGRRWGAVLDRSDEDADLVNRRPPGGGPSAAELADQAAAGLDAASNELDTHGVPSTDVRAAAARLAGLLDRLDADAWSEPGVGDAARRGAHAGIHWLRPADRAIEAARRSRD